MRVFEWKLLMCNAWKSKDGELTWETYLNHCWWPLGWWRMPFLRSNKIFEQAFDEVLLLPVSLAPLFACQTKENQSEWKINGKCKLKEVQEEEIIKKFNSLITNCWDPATGKIPPPMRLSQNRLLQLVVCRLHTSSRNQLKAVSSLRKVGEVWPWGQAQS